jgi:hypothetical protein
VEDFMREAFAGYATDEGVGLFLQINPTSLNIVDVPEIKLT